MQTLLQQVWGGWAQDSAALSAPSDATPLVHGPRFEESVGKGEH